MSRETGVTVNVLERDFDMAELNGADVRRLEVVIDGLPLFGGAQFVVDTTLVRTLHTNGVSRVEYKFIPKPLSSIFTFSSKPSSSQNHIHPKPVSSHVFGEEGGGGEGVRVGALRVGAVRG